MSYADICWGYLQKYGFITAWAIHTLTKTTCPHDVIRQLRKKYGENIFTYKDVTKTKTYKENGKEKRETKTYRIWYLNSGSRCNSVIQSAENKEEAINGI